MSQTQLMYMPKLPYAVKCPEAKGDRVTGLHLPLQHPHRRVGVWVGGWDVLIIGRAYGSAVVGRKVLEAR